LQNPLAPLVSEEALRDAPQLRIDKFHQRVERRALAGFDPA
jgi:hypothetical protein